MSGNVPAEPDALGRSHFIRQVHPSGEELRRLDRFATLLRKWNPSINLVAPATIDGLWTRHFLDSAALLTVAVAESGKWVDLGSGAGFPGLVVAMLAKERFPDLRVTCVEADQRKAAFLATVSRETSTTVEILPQRAEAAEPQAAEVVSARALAPLNRLLHLADRHLARDGIALFPKGRTFREEIASALENWRFTYETCPSATSDDAAILKIGDLRRA